MKKSYLIGAGVLVVIIIVAFFIFDTSEEKLENIIQDITDSINSCVSECDETEALNSILEGCLIECEDDAIADLINEFSQEEELEFEEISGTTDPLIDVKTCWEYCRYGDERAYYKDCVLDCF